MIRQYLKPKSDDDINGVLHNYKDKCLIIPSSSHLNSVRIQYITDGITDNNDWCSIDQNSSYLELYFLDGYSFKINSYTFVVRKGTTASTPKSWIVKGYTGTNWITIDQKNDFISNSDFRNFNISSTSPIYKIQFMQTARNALGNYHFCLRELEIFGTLAKDLGVISCNKFYADSFSILNSILTSIFFCILI